MFGFSAFYTKQLWELLNNLKTACKSSHFMHLWRLMQMQHLWSYLNLHACSYAPLTCINCKNPIKMQQMFMSSLSCRFRRSQQDMKSSLCFVLAVIYWLLKATKLKRSSSASGESNNSGHHSPFLERPRFAKMKYVAWTAGRRCAECV